MSLAESLAEALAFFPPALVVFVLAFLPVLEVRASIPVGLLYYKMGVPEVFLLSFVGNLLVIPVLHFTLPVAELIARKWAAFSRLLDNVFAFTRRKHSKKTERIEEASLFAIVALPLPGAGTWTAMLTAYVFGLAPSKTWPVVCLGAVVECVIITVVVVSGAAAWEWLI